MLDFSLSILPVSSSSITTGLVYTIGDVITPLNRGGSNQSLNQYMPGLTDTKEVELGIELGRMYVLSYWAV